MLSRVATYWRSALLACSSYQRVFQLGLSRKLFVACFDGLTGSMALWLVRLVASRVRHSYDLEHIGSIYPTTTALCCVAVDVDFDDGDLPLRTEYAVVGYGNVVDI